MSRPAGSSLQFICSSCRHALRRRPALNRQQFSTTRQLDSRALPTFRQTSSPELDSLLTEIRMKYFFPLYLNKHQQKLIRSTKRKSQLENDPVYATLGEEEIRLEPLDMTKDMPQKKSFLTAIDMFEAKDWSNLPGLLEGYHQSKSTLDPTWLGLAIKRASDDGAMGILMTCLSQVERNGFSLSIPQIREQILLGIRHTTRDADWDVEGTKGLSRAEQVLRSMEHPEHCGSRKVSEQDPRAEPYVIAIPLELAARQALRTGSDERNKVELYSSRLITALTQQKTDLTEPAAWELPQGLDRTGAIKEAVQNLDLLVAKAIPVRNALELTEKVRDQGWAEEEQIFGAHIKQQIDQKLDSALEQVDKVLSTGFETETPGVDEWRSAKK